MSYVKNRKTLTEQVEEHFRYKQSHVYHKQKRTINENSFWHPPKKQRKIINGE